MKTFSNFLIWDFFFLFLLQLGEKIHGVVQCGGYKTSPHTSTMVQFIYFWSFEISVNILRNQK